MRLHQKETAMQPDTRAAELAAFLLRIALGAMFIAHSLILKLFVFTLPGTAQFFTSIGLPGWSAYVVFALEAIGGIMLVFGVQVRIVSLILLPILAGATWAHWGNGWMFGYPNGGWEYPLYLTLLAGVQALLGEGAYAALQRSKPLSLPGLAAAPGAAR
jgi:putative oxidoreductase